MKRAREDDHDAPLQGLLAVVFPEMLERVMACMSLLQLCNFAAASKTTMAAVLYHIGRGATHAPAVLAAQLAHGLAWPTREWALRHAALFAGMFSGGRARLAWGRAPVQRAGATMCVGARSFPAYYEGLVVVPPFKFSDMVVQGLLVAFKASIDEVHARPGAAASGYTRALGEAFPALPSKWIGDVVTTHREYIEAYADSFSVARRVYVAPCGLILLPAWFEEALVNGAV
jgi:hypothetical protein